MYRRLGGPKGASPPQCGKLFCLACLHARTHARTQLNSRVAQLFKFPGLSVRLSVPLPTFFLCFCTVYAMLLWFFDACFKNFAVVFDLESIGLQFAAVFSSSLDLECNACWSFSVGFMTNCVLHIFSHLFSMLVISIHIRSHFEPVFESNSASASLE